MLTKYFFSSRYVNPKMTDRHDPYKLLELYLEQAQEAIVKAVQDLEIFASDSVSLNDFSDNLIPPPQAFQSSLPQAVQPLLEKSIQSLLPQANQSLLPQANQSSLPQANQSSLPQANQSSLPQANQSPLPQSIQSPLPQSIQSSLPQSIQSPLPQSIQSPLPPDQSNEEHSYLPKSSGSILRVCHDGKVVENGDTLRKQANGKACFSKISFSSLRSSSLGRNGKRTYSPNSRRRLWQMHPSVSFPETPLDFQSSFANNCTKSTLDFDAVEFSSDPQFIKPRKRSNSDTFTHHISTNKVQNTFGITMPPSGDVNQLSIWANNLVLELDKSFTEPLLNPDQFCDSSLNSTTAKNPMNDANLHFCTVQIQKPGQNVSPFPSQRLKPVALSSNGGTEQLSFEASKYDSSEPKCKIEELNFVNLSIPDPDFSVTPEKKLFVKTATKGSSDNSIPKEASASLCGAVQHVNTKDFTRDIQSLVDSAPSKTMRWKDHSFLKTGVSSDFSHTAGQSPYSESHSAEGRRTYYTSDEKLFHYLPLSGSKSESAIHEWKDAISQDRDIFSTVDLENAHQSSVIQPLSCNGFSWTKDVWTQTTPLPLSRSSSFTWVTEWNCSDWEVDSGAEDGRLEILDRKSSTSSFGSSSDEGPSPSSSWSSLALSDYSGSCGSFSDIIQTEVEGCEKEKPSESTATNSLQNDRDSAPKFKDSALWDVSKKPTMWMKSTGRILPHPNFNDDFLEQTTSLPSTLQSNRKWKGIGSHAQSIRPLEETEDVSRKSLSTPLLRQILYAAGSSDT